MVDDHLYQATLDDSVLSSDGEVVVAVEVEDFDFGSLPPLDIGSDVVPAKPVPMPTPTLKSATLNRFSSASNAGVSGNVSLRSNGSQQVLLGVGLAVAVMAFITVLGMGMVSLTKPLPSAPPQIKSVENEDGRQVFIIRD